MTRLRVLVVAESCNPEWESIPLEGWSHYRALSALVDAHLVTRNWNRAALARAGLVEGQDFTCIDTDALFNPAQALVRCVCGPDRGYAMLTGLSIPSYILFERILWRRLGKRLRAGAFDIVHRLTPLSPAVPSPLATRCRRLGVPFVLGPLNGGLPWPKQFPELQRREGEFASRLRNLYRLVPSYRATRDDAAALIIGGRSALADLPARWHHKTVYVPENGIEPLRFPRPALRPAASYEGRALRCVFLGRLVPFKGADLVIEAAAPLLRDGRATLEVIGFGPELARLEAMVAAAGLGGAVTLAGKLPHTELAARLRQADVMTFPSLREFGGAVVLEGMAVGVVPMVVDYGGPGELVNAATGFLLPMGDRAAIVAAMRAGLERIAADPGQLAALSARAVERAFGLFTWPVKARQTMEVYRWVTGARADRPATPIPLPDGTAG